MTEVLLEPMRPTPEQMRMSEFVEGDVVDRKPGRNLVIGKAFQRRPMIESLAAAGLFSSNQFRALSTYRHYASLADRSPLRDSLNREPGRGSRDGMTLEMITAHSIAAACERAAGRLLGILRAVVIEDKSLSQWAIQTGGGIEVQRRRGIVIEPTRLALRIAQLDITVAAQRVEAELDA